jgi:tight adherence protein B
MIIAVATFVIVLALVVGAYWAFVIRVDQSDEAVLRKRLQPEPLVESKIPKQFRLLKPVERLSNVAHLETLLGRMDWVTSKLRRDLTQAGLSMTVGTVLLASAFLAAAAFTLVKMVAFNTLLAAGAALIASVVPFIYIRFKKTQRLRKFEEQFPEAIDLMGRSLRAGHAFTTGLASRTTVPSPFSHRL